VSWARYAELFAYDEKAELFSLENPHQQATISEP
jgi:NitT/TauT family transport system ATP-binding protein